MLRRKVSLVALILSVILVLSACGGDGGKTADAVNSQGGANVTTAEALEHARLISKDMNGTMMVKNDGTVLVNRRSGYSWFDEAKDWTDIVQVSVGYNSAFGLKKDGTVVGAWSLGADNKDLSAFTDVREISANNRCVYGLKKDGTVVSAGSGALDLSSWANVKQISAGGDSKQIVIALRNDGTVLVNGYDEVMSAAQWTDIVQVSAGRLHVAGVKKDGSVVVAGKSLTESDAGEFDVGTWRNIVYVSADNQTTVGIKKDGTVVSTGRNVVESANEWTDVVGIDQGANTLMGVTKDGKILHPGTSINWTLSGEVVSEAVE